MFNDEIVRIIRTAVPIAVGGFLTWLATRWNFVLSDATNEALILVAVGVLQQAWHLLGTWLERLNPLFGWLLGMPKSRTAEGS